MPASPPSAPPPAAAPAAAPKSAPAPAPAPAPKPAASSAPPPKDDKAPEFMGEYAAELDQLSGENVQPIQVRKPKPKAPEKPAAAVKPPEGDPKPAEGEPASGTTPTPPAEPAAEPSTVPEIRKAYSALKKKTAEEYEPTIQKLQARVKELETSNPADVKTLTEKLEAAEKRREQLENEIHFVDYSKSTEFKEKFQKPYQQAWSKALFEVTQLSRTMEDGSTRKATEADILALANAPLDQLDHLAEEWFPHSAARVIRHVEKIKDLSEAQAEALENAKNAGAERAKTGEIERKASTEKTVKMLEDAHAAIGQKWPQMFGKIEGDSDGNALLEKGEAMYQKVFRPTPESAPKSTEEAIQLHALIRNKVRNHDRLALWLKKANAQIKELETALSEYESSNPNGGLDRGRPNGSAGGLKAELQDGLDELDALDKKR